MWLSEDAVGIVGKHGAVRTKRVYHGRSSGNRTCCHRGPFGKGGKGKLSIWLRVASASLSVGLWACGPPCLSLCGPICLSVSGPVGLSVGLWASLCRPVGLCLWASLSVGLCACGPLCLSASAPVGLSAFGPLGLFVLLAGRRRRDGLIGVKCCLLSLMDTSEARMTASVFVCLDLSLVALVDFRTQSCDYSIYDELLKESTVTSFYFACVIGAVIFRHSSDKVIIMQPTLRLRHWCPPLRAIVTHSRLSVTRCRNERHSSMTNAGDVLML